MSHLVRRFADQESLLPGTAPRQPCAAAVARSGGTPPDASGPAGEACVIVAGLSLVAIGWVQSLEGTERRSGCDSLIQVLSGQPFLGCCVTYSL